MAVKTEYALLQRERESRGSRGACLDRDQIVCLRTAGINQFYQSHIALYRSDPATAGEQTDTNTGRPRDKIYADSLKFG